MTRVSRLASSIASVCSGVPDGVRELAKLGTPGHPGKNDEGSAPLGESTTVESASSRLVHISDLHR